jgi:hypothetical protein
MARREIMTYVSSDSSAGEAPEEMRQREWAEANGTPWAAPRKPDEPPLPFTSDPTEDAWRDKQFARNITSLSTRTQIFLLVGLVVVLVGLYVLLRFG